MEEGGGRKISVIFYQARCWLRNSAVLGEARPIWLAINY